VRNRRVSALEMIVIAVVIAAVVAMAIWFFFIAKGGLGLGSV
jgi:hypothetical protein